MMIQNNIAADCAEFEVPLPEVLRKFGCSTKAAIGGNPNGPLIVALGGISGNRFVCRGADGGVGWWPGFVEKGCAVDPARYRILGIDFAADAAGKTAPTTADQALVLRAAFDTLGVDKADAIIGASYGGMVALSFAEQWPDRTTRLVVMSSPAEPHPAATAMRELQRRVVALGLLTGNGNEGLSIARGMAMITYRTSEEFAERFAGGLRGEHPLGPSEPGAYLRARGEAFLSRMSPERFLSLSASLDRHKIEPSKIGCPVLLIGATTDQLVPPAQMEELANKLPRAELHLLSCLYGHDMFLKEADKISALVSAFLEKR